MPLHDIPLTEAVIRGAAELERTERGGLLPHRLPAWARRQCSDPQLAMAESQPSGVRLAVRTRATRIVVRVVATKRHYTGAQPRPDGVYDLVVDGQLTAQASAPEGDSLTINMTDGTFTHRAGPAGDVVFDGLSPQDKNVEIWLPHDETTELLSLHGDAPLDHVPATSSKLWLHHGSSISHGSNAASPSTTWPALVAATAGVELINLGLGGGALLDPFTARVMRDTPADLISVKIGINIVNSDLMRLRAFGPAVHGFLDTVREGHPTTPLLVVSAISCPIHEDTPGPLAPDMDAMRDGRVSFRATGNPADTARGALTLQVVRSELERIVGNRDDANLHYLDGRDLYGVADNIRLPLPDGLHPDAATHRHIAEQFAARVFGPNGAFGHRDAVESG